MFVLKNKIKEIVYMSILHPIHICRAAGNSLRAGHDRANAIAHPFNSRRTQSSLRTSSHPYLSGCREFPPGRGWPGKCHRPSLQFPSYAKQFAYFIPSISVGLPGIEPSLHPPEGCVLPVYYSPNRIFVSLL